jgi:hypothetical protein
VLLAGGREFPEQPFRVPGVPAIGEILHLPVPLPTELELVINFKAAKSDAEGLPPMP